MKLSELIVSPLHYNGSQLRGKVSDFPHHNSKVRTPKIVCSTFVCDDNKGAQRLQNILLKGKLYYKYNNPQGSVSWDR